MPNHPEEHILILAPTGRDAYLIGESLASIGAYSYACRDMVEVCDGIMQDKGAAIIAEEALLQPGVELLTEALTSQPPWSDFPLIVLSEQGHDRAEASWQSIALIESIGNVTLLERPLHEITLLSAVRVAIRARRKQYQVRDHLFERLQAEEALRDSENKLRFQAEELDTRVRQRTSDLLSANQELEGFTYSIAHDLRSPLRRIMFTSRIIQTDYADTLDDEGRVALQELSGEASKLSLLVDDLLQYARLGKQSVNASTVDLTDMAQKILASSANPHVKSCVEPGMEAKGDPGLLELVLQNLVDNALKYANPHAAPKIWIGFDQEQNAYFVRDNGIGFDMQFAAKIFQPFERLHRDAEYPGTGIGLANVKRILERHGGKVWADSAPGLGATFYFTIS